MIEEQRKVLEMLSSGKISAEEAEELIAAVEESATSRQTDRVLAMPKKRPRYLRIISDSPTEKVDIRIPLFFLRAGMKLAGLLPRSARGRITSAFQEQGIDIDITKRADLENFIEELGEFQIEAESGHPERTEKVRIFCE